MTQRSSSGAGGARRGARRQGSDAQLRQRGARVFSCGKILGLAVRPGDAEVTAATRSGLLPSVDVVSGATLRVFKGHESFVTSVAYSPDGSLLLSAGHDTTMRLWDVEAASFEHDLSGRLASNPTARTIRGQLFHHARPGHTLTPLCLAWSPQGTIASGGQDHMVKLWREGSLLRTFDWHTGPVASVAFRPGSQAVLSASHDRSLRLWDAEAGAMIHKYTGHEELIEAAVWLDADHFASADRSGQLFIWGAERERVVLRLGPAPSAVRSLGASPDGRRLYAGLEDGTIQLYDTDLGEVLASQPAHDLGVRALALSSDGALLISGGDEGTLRIWETA